MQMLYLYCICTHRCFKKEA